MQTSTPLCSTFLYIREKLFPKRLKPFYIGFSTAWTVHVAIRPNKAGGKRFYTPVEVEELRRVIRFGVCGTGSKRGLVNAHVQPVGNRQHG